MFKPIVFILLIALLSCNNSKLNVDCTTYKEYKVRYVSITLPNCYGLFYSDTIYKSSGFINIKQDSFVVEFNAGGGERSAPEKIDAQGYKNHNLFLDSVYIDTIGRILKEVVLYHSKKSYAISVDYIDLRKEKQSLSELLGVSTDSNNRYNSFFDASNNIHTTCLIHEDAKKLFKAFKESIIDTSAYYKDKSK